MNTTPISNTPVSVEPEHDHRHPDPISGAHGSHPLGTALGSAGAAAAGAAVGSLIAGPLGFVVGGTLGAIAGGAAGHAVAEKVDPTVELEYWRGHFRARGDGDPQHDYDRDYAPAFQFGVDSYNVAEQNDWDENRERQLESDWERARGQSTLAWSKARNAVHDAWLRSDRSANTYAASDEYWHDRLTAAPKTGETDYNYRMAYRYGSYARAHHSQQFWDAALEQQLSLGWLAFRRNSLLEWEQALPAVREAFENAHMLEIKPKIGVVA